MATKVKRLVVVALAALVLAGGGLTVLGADDAAARWTGHYCVGCDDD